MICFCGAGASKVFGLAKNLLISDGIRRFRFAFVQICLLEIFDGCQPCSNGADKFRQKFAGSPFCMLFAR